MFENKKITIRFRSDESVARKGFIIKGRQVSCNDLNQFQPIHSPMNLSTRGTKLKIKDADFQDVGHALSLLAPTSSLLQSNKSTKLKSSQNSALQKNKSDTLNLSNLLDHFPKLPGRDALNKKSQIKINLEGIENQIFNIRNSKSMDAFEETLALEATRQDHINISPFNDDVPFYVDSDVFQNILNKTVPSANTTILPTTINSEEINKPISSSLTQKLKILNSLSSANNFSGNQTVSSFDNKPINFLQNNSLFSNNQAVPQLVTPCDQMLSKQVFILESPNYPNPYPSDIDCIYYIQKFMPEVCQVCTVA